MSKKEITVKYVIEESYDEQEFRRTLKATEAYLVIHDMFNEFRKVWKHGENEEHVELAEQFRDILNSLCRDRGIDLDNDLS
jgi:hypothetical protein